MAENSVLSKLNVPGSDTREGVRSNAGRDCHHASGAVQAESADSVISVGAPVDTGGSYCVK